METYNYKILCEKDYQGGNSDVDLEKLQKDLDIYGADGFRFIETVYNSDGSWIILLSCPVFPFRQKNFGHSSPSDRYSRRQKTVSLSKMMV